MEEKDLVEAIQALYFPEHWKAISDWKEEKWKINRKAVRVVVAKGTLEPFGLNPRTGKKNTETEEEIIIVPLKSRKELKDYAEKLRPLSEKERVADLIAYNSIAQQDPKWDKIFPVMGFYIRKGHIVVERKEDDPRKRARIVLENILS